MAAGTQNYSYTAIDGGGAKKSGVIEAASQDAAIAQLAAEGRFVVEIKAGGSKAAASGNSAAGGLFGPRRVAPSKQELSLFSRRMADLATAGLPLDRVIQVIIEQTENILLREVAEEALNDVRSGTPVSHALARHPKYFPEIYTQTLRAGEASGQFGEVASRLADFQETEVMRRSQIVGALTYPAVLAGVALSVVVFLVTFVMPKLTALFKDMHADLPASTKILLAMTDFVQNNWIVCIIVIVGTIVGSRLYFATPGGAYQRDRFMLHAPVIGPVIMKSTISRFARVLGTLVFGGVSILEALEIAGLSAGNRVFQVSAREVEREVRAGRPIAEAMRDAGAFPPVLTHMVAIGEETGDLPTMLSRVSSSLDFEVDTGMRRLVALAEPIIVLAMGSFVGFVVLSVLLPIFETQNNIK